MRRFLAVFGAAATGVAAAAVMDALGQGWIRSAALESMAGVILGALTGVTWPRLHHKSDPWNGAILGGSAAFVLARAPLGWLDLGGLGAGPTGQMALVVLPLVCVLGAVGAVRPRARSSAPSRR